MGSWISYGLGLEVVPASARALFTRAAMMLARLEAGPADVVDRGVHTAGLRSHCRKGLGSVEPFANEAIELTGLGGASVTDGIGIGIGPGRGAIKGYTPDVSHNSVKD